MRTLEVDLLCRRGYLLFLAENVKKKDAVE